MALSSSSPAVAARCCHLRHGVGGVASQNITDPRLGESLLDALEVGLSAHEAIAFVAEHDPTIAFRQLTAVDMSGQSATFSGEDVLGTAHQRSAENCAAAGNMLCSQDVIDAMIEAFLERAEPSLETRLLAGLAAGLSRGGEAGPLYSAGLKVTGANGWAQTDLRVDFEEDPIQRLQNLWRIWEPLRDDYQTRGIDPASAPSYGVPGDL